MSIQRVYIFDTTLRDGEQSPGASMTTEQKVRVACTLENLGVDVIEAGFPAASKKDFDSVVAISKAVTEPVIAVLARADQGDLVRASESLQDAKRGRIHTFIGTSPTHLEYKLNKTKDEVLDLISASVEFARNLHDEVACNVEWSAEDATRTDIDFICRCVETAIIKGARIINLPDTVGYMLPDEYEDLFRTVRKRVPNSDKALFSAHCHNDLGLAVANSLAAIRGGARQVECTINGIGERAGNAAMEEIVMAICTRKDVLPYFTAINTKQFLHASRLVSAVTGFVVQPNKAVVGDNAFAHESGIHQHGILKRRDTYEIMDPKDIGREESELVLGRHSGRAAVRNVLTKAGYRLKDELFEQVFERFMEIAQVKKNVLEEELLALVEDREAATSGPYELIACDIHSKARSTRALDKHLYKHHLGGDNKVPRDYLRNALVTLELRKNGVDLPRVVFRSRRGQLDAGFRAIKEMFGISARETYFHVQALGEGAGAFARAFVTLEDDTRIVRGVAADTDTVVASLKAYVNALNALVRLGGEDVEATIPRPGRLTP